MRKGTLVFLVLVVCSAVVTGSTVGLLHNHHHLAALYTKMETPAAQTDKPEVEPPVPAGNKDNSKTELVEKPSPPQNTASSRQHPAVGSQQQLLILTEDEVREIYSMFMVGYV